MKTTFRCGDLKSQNYSICSDNSLQPVGRNPLYKLTRICANADSVYMPEIKSFPIIELCWLSLNMLTVLTVNRYFHFGMTRYVKWHLQH